MHYIMYTACVFFLYFLDFDTVRAAHQVDLDLNRIHQLPNELSPIFNSIKNNHNRRSLDNDGEYDYNDNNTWNNQPRPPMYVLHPTESTGQPREDPKLFYQSELYLQEIRGRNTNHEVASIYPGREVVRAEEYRHPIRLRKMTKSLSSDRDPYFCARCPRDRTLIAKAGSDRVVLQKPRLTSCTGRRAPKQVKFVHMYGPYFGTLLHEGSHIIVGKIMINSKTLQLCKIQVHVVLQACPIPRDLVTHCNGHICNFTCRDPKYELHGLNPLVCGEDRQWEGNLPTCRARNWCKPQLPPEHGKISCRGITVDQGAGLAEGAKCKIRCALGWRASRNSVSVCRRAKWSHELYCQPKRIISL